MICGNVCRMRFARGNNRMWSAKFDANYISTDQGVLFRLERR
jgi:hypothetical protein